MKPPTDAHNEAARAWLEEWVPGYTIGQWGALAELLAKQGGATLIAAPVPCKPQPATYVYLITRPGHELDGSPLELYAHTADVAMERAAANAAGLGVTLTLVGRWVDPTSARGRRFEASLPYDDCPPWAKRWIDAQADALLAKTKSKRKGKTRAA